MSKLEELIAELCPDGVESAPLKTVVKWSCSGATPQKGNTGVLAASPKRPPTVSTAFSNPTPNFYYYNHYFVNISQKS